MVVAGIWVGTGATAGVNGIGGTAGRGSGGVREVCDDAVPSSCCPGWFEDDSGDARVRTELPLLDTVLHEAFGM